MVLALGAVLLRRWRTVLLTALATAVTAVVVTLLLPPTYATGTLLVPFAGATSRSQIALSQLPAGLAGMAGGVGASPTERLIGVVLGSGTLSDSLVNRLARGDRERAIAVSKVLRKGTRVQRNPDGSIVIQVRAKDPKLAASIANTYPELINGILARVSAEGAIRKQAFLRTQLDTAQQHLTQSEQRLLDFQQRRAAPALDDQAQRTLEVASTLQQGIYQQELIVSELRRTATADNPQLRAAQAELDSRRAQLRRLTTGSGGSREIFVPIGEGPQLKVTSTRLMRNYAQDERIYQSLVAALTDAQIDANNNLPVLTVLDPAHVPDRPTRQLPMTFALAFALGFVLGIAGIVGGEVARRLRSNAANAGFFEAWDGFRADLGRFVPFAGRHTGASAAR